MKRFLAVLGVAGGLMIAGQVALSQPEEGQFYRIKSVSSKMVLALEDGPKEEGALVVQRQPGPHEGQQWKFVKVGAFYKIVNRKTGQALNVQSASKEEGAPIIQWDASDRAPNQLWKAEQRKGGNYVFTAKHSGMALDVAGASKERKAGLIQWPINDARNQVFELVPAKK